MTINNRGRHAKKACPGKLGLTFKGSYQFSDYDRQLRINWQKMNNAQREVWGYIFENYQQAYKEKRI